MEKPTQESWTEDEVSLLDYWRVLIKRRSLVLGATLLAVLVAGLYCHFIATKIFVSKAAILAPKEQTGGGGGIAAALAAAGAGLPLGSLAAGGSPNRDAFVAILKSRTMAEDCLNRFNLRNYYDVKYVEEALAKLKDAMEISVSREGVISITVEDRDPNRAADMANFLVSNLDRLFAKLGTTDASRQRVFLADRLQKTEIALREAEEAVGRFQYRNRAIVLDAQSRFTIETAARLKGEIIAAEVALESMRAFATETNPQVIQQKLRIEELKRQVAEAQHGRGMELPSERRQPGVKREEFFVPIAKVPELGLELIRLTRELKIQETVFNLLTSQYEQAKIAEARDTPTVQLLDKAVPAERKSKPRTVFSMAIAGIMSFFVAVFLAFFLEYLDRIKRKQSATE